MSYNKYIDREKKLNHRPSGTRNKDEHLSKSIQENIIMSTIQLHPILFKELQRIVNAGHGVGIKESEDKGNSHTSAYIVISVKHSEQAFINKLLVKFTSSYGNFVSFTLIGEDFEELQYEEYSDLEEVLNFINSKLEAWNEKCNSSNCETRRAWQNKMAKIES